MDENNEPNLWPQIYDLLKNIYLRSGKSTPQRIRGFLRILVKASINSVRRLFHTPQSKGIGEILANDTIRLPNELIDVFEKMMVSDYYVMETRQWIHAIVSAETSNDVYRVMSEQINDFLEGKSRVLFTPLAADSHDQQLIDLLHSGQAESAFTFFEGMTAEQAWTYLSDDSTALVHLAVTPDGTFILITQRNQPLELIMEPSITRQKIENILRGWISLYYWQSKDIYQKTVDQIARKAAVSPAEREAMRQIGWQLPYQKIFYNEAIFDHFRPTEIPLFGANPVVPFPGWILMEVVLRVLGEGYADFSSGLWNRLHAKLSDRNVRRIILAPDKALALFPHHAAILSIDGNGRKQFVLDHYQVSYLPQGVLTHLASSPAIYPQRILAFGDENEPLSAASVFGLSASLPENITALSGPIGDQKLSKGMVGYDGLTFVGHAEYNWNAPEKSYLEVTDNPQFFLKNFLKALPPDLKIVTLAACGIGLPQVGSHTSDYKGFAEDLLLKAQVPIVVSTLWPVYQISTVLLMQYFHECLLSSDTESKPHRVYSALARSQLWLRDAHKVELVEKLKSLSNHPGIGKSEQETLEQQTRNIENQTLEYPFAHPYFWAPFYVMGDVG